MNSRIVLSICALVMPVAALAQNERALERSRAFLDANRSAWGLNTDNEVRVTRVRAGAGNLTHVKHQQFYKGVPVFEGEAITHVDAAGNVTVTDALYGGLSLDVSATIPQGQVQGIVRSALRVRGAATISSVLEVLPKGERSSADVLTWHAKVFFENNVDGIGEFDVFVDAKSGQVVWMFNSLQTSATTGWGNTKYAGLVNLPIDVVNGMYSTVSPNQSSLRTTDMNNGTSGTGTTFSNNSGTFGDYSFTNRATAGADAHYGQTLTWAYFQNIFHRNGIDGAGRSSYGRVHYSSGYENAYWSSSCFCMTYGDGASTFLPLVSLDVTGHEMAHGVMAGEANLTYSGESGGLNESSSDIFGSLVEKYAANSQDTFDWWIGERIYKSNWSGTSYTQTKALRYMDNPGKDGRSPACWSRNVKSLDVHYSSGPNNHMFYLLAAGGTSACNGKMVTGIGTDKAAAIWYKAISDYMTARTGYSGARQAALNAAAALYGAGSVEYNAVAAAYSAINVN